MTDDLLFETYVAGTAETVPKDAPEADFADPPRGLYVGDAKHAALAVQAVTGGFRGNKAKARSSPGVKGKIASAIRKFYKGAEQKYYLSWLHTGRKPGEKPAAETRVSEMYISAPSYNIEDEPRFPDVPTSPGVDLAGLMAARNDTSPVFFVRPLAILDEVSDNGLPYNKAICDDIYEQVLARRPAARRGHVSAADKGSAFPPDEGYWIGIVWDSLYYGKPALFGRCYVVPGETRDMVLSRRATGTALSNSLWGDVTWAGDEPVAVRIETIDIVPEERAALQALGGEFVVTSEMKEDDMAEEGKAATLAETLSSAKPEDLHEALQAAGCAHRMAEMHMKAGSCAECDGTSLHEMLTSAQRRSVSELSLHETSPEETYGLLSPAQRTTVAEMLCKEMGLKMTAAEETKAVAEMTTQLAEMPALKTRLAEMETVIKQYQRQEFERALADTVAAFFSDWHVTTASGQEKLNALKTNLRVLTVAEMAGSTRVEDVKTAADKAWSSVKPLAEMTLAALAGPAVHVGAVTVNGGGPKRNGYDAQTGRYDDEAVSAAARMTGVLGGRSGGVR